MSVPTGLQAQQGAPVIDPHDYTIRAVRIPGAITLDGVLDEPAWRRAQPASGFTQRNPDEGAPASERTEIRILFNGSTLFIGARMYDARPQDLVVSQMRRDSRLMGDDYLDIVIDTFHDHRNAFQFQVNPAGARYDAYITDEGRDVNGDFNVVWDAATAVDPEGWSAEIAIPFSQLRFAESEGEQTWGINFYRNLRHKNEEDYWVPTPRDFGYRAITRMSNAGLLLGLEEIRSGRNVQVRPYGLGGAGLSRVRVPEPGEPARDTNSLADLGLDMKVGVTPSMTLDLTYNTDFAQVEADQERVNLTRFSLFFPEKRDFFLEGAGIFSGGGGGGGGFGGGGFGGGGGGGGQGLQLFYSRNIGIADGEEVPILVGGKLTGRSGPWTVGALNVVTQPKTLEEGDTEPRTLWSVVSLRRNILSRSSVGLLATSKDPQAGSSNRTFGVDANLALGNFTSVRTQLATVSGADTGSDTYAYTGSFNYDTDLWQLRLNTQRVGEDFDPAMGYLRRSSIRESRIEMEYGPRPNALGIRQLTLTPEGSYLTDLEGRLLTRELQLRTAFFMENTSSVFLTFSRRFEQEPDGFTVYTDPDDDSTVDVEPGSYEWSEVSVRARSDGRGALSLGGGGNWTVGWWGGRRLGGNVDLTWRPVPNSSNTLSLSRNEVWDLRTPGRNGFVTNTLSLRVNYAFTPRVFTKAYVQYNDARNAIVSNYLLHWIVRDGTEVYLVYNEQYDTGEGFEPFATNRTLILKATYLLLW